MRGRAVVRWLAGTSLALLLVAAAGFCWIYVASEAHLRSFPQPPPFRFAIPTDAAAIARGDHLVRTRGCRGCHGDRLQGQQMWGYAVAPNLPLYARTRSAAEVEAALRHGIAHDGRAMYDMPAFNFIRLRDADVADIIAYLRAVPVEPVALPVARLPWGIRLRLARGTNQAIPAFIPRVPALRHANDPDPRIVRGEYLAMTTCIECHGLTLHADAPFGDETAPDLAVIAGYDLAAFMRLMRTGKALGDRELEMMSPVARGRFVYFSDEEVSDLYAFLRANVAPASREP
ncbi:MAG: cytochrome c [Pseudomonadota bacterium]